MLLSPNDQKRNITLITEQLRRKLSIESNRNKIERLLSQTENALNKIIAKNNKNIGKELRLIY